MCVAFSPDGKTLASASEDQTVILWDLVAHKPLGEPLAGHKRRVFSVTFSPDGRNLASASEDGTVILWDVPARKPLGEPLAGHERIVFSVAFSPDGKTLASASSDPTGASASLDKAVILWEVALDLWQDWACRVANRNLSCEEWRNFMGERRYQKVCNNLPAPEPTCS